MERLRFGGLAGKGRRMRTPGWVLTAVTTFSLMGTAPALADDFNPLVDWSTLTPGLTDQYDPNSANECTSGKVKCVDAVIREMNKRFTPLAQSCDHNALFSLLYLRVTQTYRQAVDDPNFFEDNAFVNHEDAVFANYYFRARDDYKAGRIGDVPRAWQVALDAARDRAVNGTGDLLLGINAHVQRDLPYVLEAIGLVKPDGSSRKPDHDKVNQILYAAYQPAITEGAQRFDPSINFELPAPFTAYGYQTFFQAVEVWREAAWRNAERLVTAPNAASRALVAQQIEDYAASQAQMIRSATAYSAVQTGTDREAFCAMHHG
jgi:hypothetical protein